MKNEYKPIVNSDLIGDYVTIELPGFPGRHEKPEPCRIHYLTMGSGEPLLLVHSVGQSIYTWRGGNDAPFKEMMDCFRSPTAITDRPPSACAASFTSRRRHFHCSTLVSWNSSSAQ